MLMITGEGPISQTAQAGAPARTRKNSPSVIRNGRHTGKNDSPDGDVEGSEGRESSECGVSATEQLGHSQPLSNREILKGEILRIFADQVCLWVRLRSGMILGV